jgi:UDP-3-O-[3-hydroxymyristoyl] glucosamine N-acyltransferase
LKLSEIADRLGCGLEGDGNIHIARVATLESAGPGDLSFVTSAKYHRLLSTTRASAVILGSSEPAGARPVALLRSPHPSVTLAQALRLLAPSAPPPTGVDRLSAIASDATVGPAASIGPFVAVGPGASIGARAVIYPNVVIGPNARVGDDCVLHAGVSIHDGVIIGDRVTILDGAVIGSDGFGFARQPDGTHLKIPQRAAVVIEDDVEIGANTTIDRPAVGETRVAAGTKIDNLVHVAHGVKVGRRVLLAAQVGIAGSTTVEDDVMMGGQVGVGGHLVVAKGTVAGGQSGITRSTDAGSYLSGYPAIDNLTWRKAQVIFRRLPELKSRIEELEQRVAELEEKLTACVQPDR